DTLFQRYRLAGADIADADIDQPIPSFSADDKHGVGDGGGRAGFFPHQHARSPGDDLEAQLVQQCTEQKILFVAVATAPMVYQLVLQVCQVQANLSARDDIQV